VSPARCLLGRGAEALVSLPALRNLRLERMQGLVGGAADGADQGGRPLHHRIHVVPREALLHLDDRRRVREAEQLLCGTQVGLHDTLNQARHAAAAGILAVEAYHASEIRVLLLQQEPDLSAVVQKISDLRAALSGAADDQGILLDGVANIVPADSNSLAFSRTTRQVLNIVYGAADATSGLFFPAGLNGSIA